MPLKARDVLHKLDLAYMHLFNTPEGEEILADLKKHFMLDRLTTDNAHTTVVRASHSDPIRYILRRIQNGMDGKSVR